MAPMYAYTAVWTTGEVIRGKVAAASTSAAERTVRAYAARHLPGRPPKRVTTRVLHRLNPSSFPWVYRPGIMDRTHPTVIKGRPIAVGARIKKVANAPGMKGGPFQFVQDEHGNVQSIWKRAMWRA